MKPTMVVKVEKRPFSIADLAALPLGLLFKAKGDKPYRKSVVSGYLNMEHYIA